MATADKQDGGNPNGCKQISLEAIPPKTEALKERANSPAEIDPATIELGIPAELFNVELATPADLSYLNIGLGKSVYIPKQIADREGGRKSQYLLCKGETVMTGIYANNCGILRRFVTRLTGDTPKAKTGDIYMEQLRTRDGRLTYEGTGALKITDERKGIGEITFAQTRTPQYSLGAESKTKVWVLWSCILVEQD